MFLSQTSRYALQAATFLAEHCREDRAIPVGEIAGAIGVPRNYLSKILHQLARHGVLESLRGPTGGFRLARAPREIRLIEVVDPLEPGLRERHCLLGRPSCRDETACAAHDRWSRLVEAAERFLEETTLADLAGGGL